ncbi:uncharacterized protein LOC123873432 [Maniola jurtina]|uniref:uncharacterized protein LOC123873432 n=1 Tax=Maniola jurtina TaxID=191418 RepID=UPI001E68CD35|nr:uncharacterized protein LOC123873432 [Maniola jurtina]
MTVKQNKKELYMECKKKAKRAVAIARGKTQEKLYRSLESPQGQKDLYRLARAREKNERDITHIKCIKDNEKKVLTNDDDIKDRWREYFRKLMNEENEWSGELANVPTNLGVVKQVSIDEVRMAVLSMKNGRATGPDSIPAEVWKFLKGDGWSWLALFFNKMLHEEEIPEEWCNSLLVPIYKNKGDYEDLGKSDRKKNERGD